LIIVNISLDIFFRYVLVAPLSWSSQLAKYLMIWFAFLGSGLAFRKAAHVSADVLVRQLDDRWKRRLAVVSYLGVMIFLILVAIYGFIFAYSLKKDFDPLLGIGMIYPFLAVPVGSLFMLVQVAWIFMKTVRNETFMSPSLDKINF